MEAMQVTKRQDRDFWSLSPIEQLNVLREEINRLFEAPLSRLFSPTEFFRGWLPPLDMREDKDNFIVSVELPGMKKEDIQVMVHEGVLTISGERKREYQVEDEGVYRSERYYGKFHRTVTLPKPIKEDQIKATYKDGVLTIILPKTEEAKPKQIEVSVD